MKREYRAKHYFSFITRVTGFAGVISLLVSCTDGKTPQKPSSAEIPVAVPALTYHYMAKYPHDTTAFTEGLLFHEGQLFESTGATSNLPQTRSLFGTVDLTTGAITVKAELDKDQYFGEGITILNGKVYQLTYKSRKGFVWDANTYEQLKTFDLPGKEGWGMTTDGSSLIMSDGTNTLTWLDPESLQMIRTLNVTEKGRRRRDLNELEYINGYIYANIWMTNEIVKIDPSNGEIVGKLDLSPFAQESKAIYPGAEEMNGIAWHPEKQEMWVTGKMWPVIYALKVAHE